MEARKTIRDALEVKVLVPECFTTPPSMIAYGEYYRRRNLYDKP